MVSEQRRGVLQVGEGKPLRKAPDVLSAHEGNEPVATWGTQSVSKASLLPLAQAPAGPFEQGLCFFARNCRATVNNGGA